MKLSAKSYEEGGLIDLPQSQGVIYTESCKTCLVDNQYGVDALDGCSFCPDLISNFFLEDNTFSNNYDDSAFFAQHNLPRANLLYAKGGANFKITGNAAFH